MSYMKKFAGITLFVGIISLQGCGTKVIDYGDVGIKVNLVGDNRGVDNEMYSPGRVFYNSFTEAVYEFPTTVQSRIWTSSKSEGNPIDESISFSSIEATPVNLNVYMAYSFDPRKIPHLVRKYKLDANKIAEIYIRSGLRGEFSIYGGKMKAVNIAGPGKIELAANVLAGLNKRFSEDGIIFSDVNIVGEVNLDPNIQKAVNATITATQNAIAAENNKRVTQAIADQAVIQANGDKAAIAANPNYLEQKKIEGWIRWGCPMPKVMGGTVSSFNDVTKFLK